MRPATIRSTREMDRIFREGARSSSGTMVTLASPTPSERGLEGRVAFVAGTKLGNAVVRNRAKRLLRETVRREGGPWPGWDVVVVARAGALRASADRLGEDLRLNLHTLGIAR